MVSRFFPKIKKKQIKHVSRIIVWFTIGGLIALFFISSFSYFAFQNFYSGRVYPGVRIDGVDFGRKSEMDVGNYFRQKSKRAEDLSFVFSYEGKGATVSAKEIEFGYDDKLLTQQALSIGRSSDPFSNVSLILQAYTKGVDLSSSFKFSETKLDEKLDSFYKEINKEPVEAVFNFEDGRVKAFRASQDGQKVNKDELSQQITTKAKLILGYTNQKIIIITIPTIKISPALTTEKVNKMGIKELIGTGTSLFQHSIESRIYNVNLAASRINGVLVAPGETFSFAKAVGDVSSLTGYKQAYVIENGKTVLGDGGGVCQVSTTLFRAALNAGLPIVERHPHAYRVQYYEQDSPAGIDATVYVPSVDLKFKNDTGHYILIQSIVDLNELRLTFMIYGTNDGRITTMTTPLVTNVSAPPPDKYEDDPTLPAGTVKQVDFAAGGADASFTRTVTKSGKVLYFDTFKSHYRPWQAVYLRGTKQ